MNETIKRLAMEYIKAKNKVNLLTDFSSREECIETMRVWDVYARAIAYEVIHAIAVEKELV